MNNKNKQLKIFIFCITFFIFVGLLFNFFLKSSTPTKAGINDNVYGWAWSENIGWISFNSSTGGGGTDYGVNIESDGTITGYAWSENIGWISFNESDLTGCPQSPCKAWVDPLTGTVYGWAKALAANDPQSGGWEGWIHLQGSNYGVFIDTSSTPAEFEGWAWGEDVLGWISFNCDNPETGNVCSQSDYKVYTTFSLNSPPVVQNPHISSEDYCVSETTGKITFEWTYSDPDNDNQSRFDLIVSSVYNINPESIPNPEVNRTVNITNPSPSTNSQYVYVIPSSESDKLQYNKTYYWWVRVWDDQGNDSGWVYVGNFNTALHAYPYISFDWIPQNPVVEETVAMINNSTCYDINNNPVECPNWLWQIPSTAEFTDGTSQTIKEPHIIFHETGNNSVTLQATDATGYSCSRTKTISIQAPLPGWIEIPPK